MIRIFALVLAASIVAACASVSPDGGIGAVQEIAGSRAPQKLEYFQTDAARAAAAKAVRERLRDPLSSSGAVAIALINNPGLQAAYSELRIAEADLVQATRLANPGFSFARYHRGDEREIEKQITFDVVGLVTMPWRVEAERGLYRAAQLRAAAEVARVADEARRAWVEAVAARELAQYAQQVKEAAEASAEIAAQMARAGNFSRLAQSREHVFYAEATAQLARSKLAAVSARERLTRVLGLWGDDIAFRLPERLPDLPAAPVELRDAESQAISDRLDVRASREETEALARSLGISRATRFVNVLELGYERDTSSVLPARTGYQVELTLPIFDWGDARVAKAEGAYMRSFNRTAETAIAARSQVREGYAAYRTAYDLARHYREEIVPLRKRISEENLLRYNGMLISVFELLADAREQITAVTAAIEAGRDYWIAEANLETALTTGH
ncbi:MAG TPA: TolC family protein [Usitatibacter sp.]|nr:TolC family protein [Usitatibacter sp.]